MRKSWWMWIFINAPICFSAFIIISICENDFQGGWLVALTNALCAGLIIYNLESP